MADNQITKDVYKQYAHKIVSVLKNEEFYEQFKKRVDKGSSSFKLAKKRLSIRLYVIRVSLSFRKRISWTYRLHEVSLPNQSSFSRSIPI